MADSDFFHIKVARKSIFSFELFSLGKKYQGHTMLNKETEEIVKVTK